MFMGLFGYPCLGISGVLGTFDLSICALVHRGHLLTSCEPLGKRILFHMANATWGHLGWVWLSWACIVSQGVFCCKACMRTSTFMCREAVLDQRLDTYSFLVGVARLSSGQPHACLRIDKARDKPSLHRACSQHVLVTRTMLFQAGLASQ